MGNNLSKYDALLVNEDECKRIRQDRKFANTNDIWNDLELNRGWSIGHIGKIVGDKRLKSAKEWENHYLETGKRRKALLNEKPQEIRGKLENLRAHYEDRYNYRKNLEWSDIDINEANGRTVEELRDLGRVLYRGIIKQGNKDNLTVGDCMKYVYVRVVYESYIGIKREENTTRMLEEKYPDLEFRKTSSFIDRTYAIDVEVYGKDGNRICGIQIKSEYFLSGKSRKMVEAQKMNDEKMDKYRNKYNTYAFYACSNEDGRIGNIDIYGQLEKLTA